MNQIIKYLSTLASVAWLVQPLMSSGILSIQTIKRQEESTRNLCAERIYMHTDRDIYIAGENLFFKLYLYDEVSQKISDKSKFAYIIICDSKNNQFFQQSINLSAGISYGCIVLPDTLETGNYQIIAYTNWMRNFGDSTFFQKQLIIANRFDENPANAMPEIKNTEEYSRKTENNNFLTLATEKVFYHQREKVKLVFSLPKDINANVSISVSEQPPEKYNNKTFVETISSWNLNIANSHFNRTICEYLREDKGFIISGFVINTPSVSGITVTLSTPDTIANLKYSITDASGRFLFQLDDFYYNKELYITLPEQDIRTESTLILDNKYDFYPNSVQPGTFMSDRLKKFINKSQTITTINKTCKIQSVSNSLETGLGGIRRILYYKPDYRVFLSDYVPLNNFNEIVREILPYVRLRKSNNIYEIDLIDSENKTHLKNPAIFINGVLGNNINNFINYGSDKIYMIETVCHKRVFGSLEFNGILSIRTSADVKNDIFFNQQSLHLPPVSFQNKYYYYTPEYSSREKIISRIPDFRQLLYWNPSVEINAGQLLPIEFYTSDNKGSYVIDVEGITSDGTPISYKEFFSVR
jgi:hypothetical protein